MPGTGTIQAFRQLQVELSPTGCSAKFDLASERLCFGDNSGYVVSVWFLFGTHWRKGVRQSAGNGLLTVSCVYLHGHVLGKAMLRVDFVAPTEGLARQQGFAVVWFAGLARPTSWAWKQQQALPQDKISTGASIYPFCFSLKASNPCTQCAWALSPHIVFKPACSLCRLLTAQSLLSLPPAQGRQPPCCLSRQLLWAMKGGEGISFYTGAVLFVCSWERRGGHEEEMW